MQNGLVEVLLAGAGLCALLSFAKTMQHGPVSKFSAFVGLLQVPAIIAAIWIFVVTAGWWAVALFFGCVLFTSLLLVAISRKSGMLVLFRLQPVFGAGFIALISASLVARLI